MTEIRRIHNQLERSFYRGSWIGPTVLGVLDGMMASGALLRPVNNAHTVWEITNHIAFWENLARRMLLGESINTAMEARRDWKPITDGTDEAWHDTLVNLRQTHVNLAETVLSLDDDILGELSPEVGASFTVYELLHGIVQHNVYHAGQIGLLKKTAIFPTRKGPLLSETSVAVQK